MATIDIEPRANSPKANSQFRKFFSAIHNLTGEFFPGYKSASEYITQGLCDLKRSWLFVLVIVLLSFGTGCWLVFSYMTKRVEHIQDTRTILSPYYEDIFARAGNGNNAAGNLGDEGNKAFESGDYSYSLKFFDADFDHDSYGEQWVIQRPLHAADRWALNPTPKGFKAFQDDMDSMLNDIKQAHGARLTGSSTSKAFYNKKAYLGEIA